MTAALDTTPAFLCVGPAARDVVPGGWRWGGTVTYAALLARAWGISTAVLTAMAEDDVAPYRTLLGNEVLLHALPSMHTTSMANEYNAAGRRQRFVSKAARIEPRHVPPAWRQASIVLVGPLLGEVSTRLGSHFPTESLRAMTIQGRLRTHRKERMYTRRWPRAAQEFGAYDVLIFSEEDVRGDRGQAEFYAGLVPLAVMTHGGAGATVFAQGNATHHAAFGAEPVDETGAGDVFAAAFLLTYATSRDPAASCRYANAAAACSIEHVGIAGIPTRRQVAARMRSTADL